MKKIAIVLAAGRGKRMNSDVAKQYLMLGDKPVLYYSLKMFEESDIDEVYLVTTLEECAYCEKEIVEKFGFEKIVRVVAGGKERYHSVYEGLKAVSENNQLSKTTYIYIHDGARPFLDKEMLGRLHETVLEFGVAVAAVPCKDTIKKTDSKGFVIETPNRESMWQVQTPQVFSFDMVLSAYTKLMQQEEKFRAKGISITDDAMVVESLLGGTIKLVEGDYKNIKITTPEDLLVAHAFLNSI
ncbi:MAG: 2-C-methyl-D-erythritol 4-phosphate cytidylyltransferase [Lachnospiraceae bacterium]